LVIAPQIHGGDRHVGHRRQPAAGTHELGHRRGVQRRFQVQQLPQRLLHAALPLPGRQVEDRQILGDRLGGSLLLQHVVDPPEPAAREHRVAMAIRLERPRLPNQPINDMRILDFALASAPQPRQVVHRAGAVPDLQRFGPDLDLDPFADQLTLK
jgi:hypothetical protein